MKKVMLHLGAILAVLVYIAVSQHQAREEAVREHAKRTLSECWDNAIRNGGGGEVCMSLAKAIDK